MGRERFSRLASLYGLFPSVFALPPASTKSLCFEALQKGSERNPMGYARGARFFRESLGVSG